MCRDREWVQKSLVTGRVAGQERLTGDVYRIRIEGDFLEDFTREAKPGQFVNVYMKDKSTLLPRPVSICRIQSDQMELVYRVVGKGTREMAGYHRGDAIRLSSPLGKGFDLSGCQSGSALLVGGGVGIPPLLQLAGELNHRGIRPMAVLGFQREPFLVQEMEKLCDKVLVATEDGSIGFAGNVVQLIEKEGQERGMAADQAFSCGPKPMLKALADLCREREIPLQVSLEERMGCGYGACVGCAVDIKRDGKIQRKAVCKDGPVFWAEEVFWHAE